MKRAVTITILIAAIIFAVLASALCALLIQNYREQFDMEMTSEQMRWHVRNASIALAVFLAIFGLASWQLVRVVRQPRQRESPPN